MSVRGGVRPQWSELPLALRTGIEEALGAAVVGSSSRAGGWSPGTADVVELADGRTVFVKTADALVNARTVDMHRREAAVLRLLDGTVAPALLATVDAGRWFALAVAAIDGRHPDPASAQDTAAVLDAVAALPAASGHLLHPIEEELVEDSRGWERLLEDRAAPPEPAARASIASRRSPRGCRTRCTAARWCTGTCGSTTRWWTPRGGGG